MKRRNKYAASIVAAGSGEELIPVREEYLLPYLRLIRDNKRLFRAAVAKASVLGGQETFERLSREELPNMMAVIRHVTLPTGNGVPAGEQACDFAASYDIGGSAGRQTE